MDTRRNANRDYEPIKQKSLERGHFTMCLTFDFRDNWSCLSQESPSIGFLLASLCLQTLIIKFRSNERGQNSNKDDFMRSTSVLSSAAILNDRHINRTNMKPYKKLKPRGTT